MVPQCCQSQRQRSPGEAEAPASLSGLLHGERENIEPHARTTCTNRFILKCTSDLRELGTFTNRVFEFSLRHEHNLSVPELLEESCAISLLSSKPKFLAILFLWRNFESENHVIIVLTLTIPILI